MRRHTLLLLPLLLAGCFPGPADNPKDVWDLRVLGMRLDPPEVELPLDPNAPPTPVQLTVLAASPERGAVRLAVRGCPSPSSTACADFVPEDPTLFASLTRETVVREDLPDAPEAPELRSVMDRDLDTALLGHLMETADLLGLAGARPAFEVAASADVGGAEVAFKRLQVSYPDLVYRSALEQAGIVLCDAAGAPAGCLEWRTKVAGTNPTIERITWLRDDEVGSGTEPRLVEDGVIPVATGEGVRIFPEASAASVESYQTLGVDFENQSLVVNDVDEVLIYSWFGSGGTLDLFTTEPERDFGAYNDWIAPTTAGDYWLWLVLRDTRGGEDFATLRMHVE